MPEEGIALRDRSEFITQEELFEFVDTFIDLGVKKIRLTGGEPLLKKNFAQIFEYLNQKGVELAITTNGILLDKYWDLLQDSNLKTLNISIDSLQEERFNAITRRKFFDRVLGNIHEAIKRGFNVKLNAVLIKGENDDEIVDFAELTKDLDVAIRFIEFMPFDGNNWDWSKTVSYQTIVSQLQFEYGDKVSQLETEKNGTSKRFKVSGYKGEIGIISSVTNPFCDSCNRIRLTADGKIKNCLFSSEELDLLAEMRKGKDIKSIIATSIQNKHAERGGLKPFDDNSFSSDNRSMTTIGG